MSMQIAAMGNALKQELPQEGPSSRAAQIRAAEVRAAALDKLAASLPDGKLEALEKIGLAFNRKLKFVVDHQSHEITVKVIDGQTDKVIKVLPPEELQRLHGKIRETIGFLFDEKV